MAGVRSSSNRVRVGLAALGCLVLMPSAAMAHVPHPAEVELFDGTDGPYVMRVVAVPYVGHLHVTVMFEPGSSAPLGYEPQVRVSAAPEGGEGANLGPATARLETFTPTHDYSTTLEPETEGDWTVFVEVESEMGETSMAFPIVLRDPGGIPTTAILTGLGLLAPIVWLVWTGVRDRRRRKGRGAPGGRRVAMRKHA